jgi:cleavage and polyadenylation specificity factor subunit 4
MATATSAAPSQLASGLLNHVPEPYTFSFTPFLQKTYNHSLPADRPICKSYAATAHCPNGTRCPDRHVYNGPPGTSGGRHHDGERGGFNSLVCKHWLRGLCKKGEACEFLHEYNLRKMPECSFYARNGYCSNGDECLYLHIDPAAKLPPCPHYEMRGFCPLGPNCSKKHVRRTLCPLYLAGFCPNGKACPDGAHPHWKSDKELDEPTVKVERPPEEIEAERLQKEEEAWEREKEHRERQDREGGGYGRYDRKDKADGGRRGGWRGGGGGGGRGAGQRFRGRN